LWRLFGRTNRKEHAIVYLLATLSNLLISTAEYLAVRQAALSYLPLDTGTTQLISRYGVNTSLDLAFLWTLAIFQAILTITVIALALVPLLNRGWRVSYIFSGLFVFGFVSYWIGAKFLRTLGWISLMENSGIDVSAVYSDLFWFGLGATVCYVTLLLVMRKSYDKIVLSRSVLQSGTF